MWWAHEVAGWEAWCRVGLSGYIGRGVGWSGSGNYRVVYRLGSSGYLPFLCLLQDEEENVRWPPYGRGQLACLVGHDVADSFYPAHQVGRQASTGLRQW